MPERDEEVQNDTKTAVVVAFVAASAQTGRTSTVANQAWILASAGHRVLVLDLGTTPTVHDYLRRFGPDRTVPAVPSASSVPSSEGANRQLTDLVAAADPRGGRANPPRRYPLPEPALPVDAVSLDRPPAQGARSALVTVEDADRLRRALHGSGYDYVLVDLPTVSGDGYVHLANLICDVLVVGLTPQQEAVWTAKALVDRVRQAAGGPRIILASSPFSGGSDVELQRDRNLVLTAFADLLTGDAPIEHVEIPHQPGHAAHQTIATLIEEPGPDAVIAPAHEQLASVITVGAVTGQGPVADRMRARYRLGLGMGKPDSEETIWLGYAPRDRVWADWIAEQIRMPGIAVRRFTSGTTPPPGATVILVLSAALPDWFTDPEAQQRLRSGGLDLVTVRVPGDQPPDELTDPGRLVDLTSIDPDAAVSALRSALWLFPADPGRREARYPIGAPGGGVPPVNPRFVGREAQLEALREALCPIENGGAGQKLRLVSMYGRSGVGKSEIAREYAHRFGRMYEFVWWIPAADEQTVRSRLVDLGITRLNMDPSDIEAPQVLEELSGGAYGRWLLVYDNASDDIFDELTPRSGNGDVIITTPRPLAGGSRLEILGLNPRDSRELLNARVTGLRGITEEQTVAIGGQLGYMPIALRLAASWLRQTARMQRETLMPREAAVEFAADELARRLGELGPPPGAPDELVLRMLLLTAEVLGDSRPGALAITLAQLCSFLDPDGIALRLLRSKPMLAELAAATGGAGEEDLVLDEIEIERVLWTGVRFGLFDVEQSVALQPDGAAELTGRRPLGALRLHRTVQQALRTELDQSGLLDTRQAQLLRGLAGFAPTNVETHPERRADFAELHRHLDELDLPAIDFTALAGVLGDAGRPGSDGWNVRMWIVAQIRYLFLEPGIELARSTSSLARRLDQAWIAAFSEADRLRCRLAVQRANLLRNLGQAEEAMRLDEQVLRFQRRDLGLNHPRTLITARSFAGDYRERGDFDTALAENEAAWLGFTQVFGNDHAETLAVAFNLAHNRFLAGLISQALELLESTYRDQLRVLGEDHPRVWQSGRLLATYLGELGRYGEALDHLDKVTRTQLRLGWPNEAEMLQAERTQVVLERRANEPGRDRARRLTMLLRQFERQFGETSAFTAGCKLSLAAELCSRGESETAAELGAECVTGFREQFGEYHPFTGACRVNQLRFLRASGRLEQVLEDGAGVLSDLTDWLDPGHPWVIAAAVNQSAALADAGRLGDARALIEPAYTEALNSISARHPTTIAAASNLKRIKRLADRSATGAAPDADEHAWQLIDIHLP
jgi:cellulose biosynthesis protein BcsQ/tetratricopeptide (TPR) repeat protein